MSQDEYPYKATELYRKLLDSTSVEIIYNENIEKPECKTIARFRCDCKFVNQLMVSADELNELARSTFFYILKLCGLDEVDLQDLMMVRSMRLTHKL